MSSMDVAGLKLSEVALNLHCPACNSGNVRRSRRKNIFEILLLGCFLRPFRCEICSHRFYDHVLRRRTRVVDSTRERSRANLLNVPVVVYGCGLDGEAFHEDTSLRIRQGESAVLHLGVCVEPGQELILMNLASEEERRCRVTSVKGGTEGGYLINVNLSGSVGNSGTAVRQRMFRAALPRRS